ncbi:MAG: hypothetical protein QM773_20860 [Hyphomonadaceae bacterium]
MLCGLLRGDVAGRAIAASFAASGESMFRIPAALIAGFALAASAAAQEAPSALKMKSRVIGPLRSEWLQADVLALGLPVEREDSNVEGDPVFIYTVHVDDRNTASIWFDEHGSPYMIKTTSSGFTTSEGAHVGNTIAELQRLYPKGSVFKSMEEGPHLGFVLERSDRVSNIFRFDTRGLPLECLVFDKGCPDIRDRQSISFETRWR